MRPFYRGVFLAIAVILFGTPLLALADPMTSSNFQIPWDAWGAGGNEQGTSTSYRIDDTIGGTAVGTSTSASYALRAGYRLGDAEALSFAVTMAPVAGTSKAYTALDIVGRTVTIASLPNPFSVGQAIAVEESPGLSQKTVVGRIVALSGMLITVDRFDGDTGTMSASPVTGQVVELSGGDISFGEISVSSAAVATGMVAVSAPTPAGYSLFVQSAAPLASTGHTITAVADGAVSLGAEEYGVITRGTQATLSSDTALTTTATTVQQATVATGINGDRSAFLYKLAISSSTPGGSYSQAVFFTLTPNY